MNKYISYIVFSVIAILIPLIGLLYGYWDASRPKIGPVGDGTQVAFTPAQLAANIGVMLTGVLNLAVAIKKYLDYKKSKEEDNQSLND
ncbi:hypothetical protein PAECIP111891_05594 [Paenibacillus allorhizoplanae]|uniref:Uncharacterized protein n=1 Tax=Paenibacillus allorhizoplanae TaxID=2905648 RepID=A0ABM9CVK7_9BACL|nr:hypothetical protein [Paenibacillus allorhizoplanae]CAH1223976.1 hypothetical protein PAECIP111891_05594 [Paenibacillus allorhizoplanae]